MITMNSGKIRHRCLIYVLNLNRNKKECAKNTTLTFKMQIIYRALVLLKQLQCYLFKDWRRPLCVLFVKHPSSQVILAVIYSVLFHLKHPNVEVICIYWFSYSFFIVLITT